ncbi:MAG: guanine deaminase [Gammaproteobacteria bacterium]|nr:guanine deaminase [Gammaproteobacteria bacterium]
MTAFRGKIVHCLRDPGIESDSEAVEFFPDGLLVLRNGHVLEVGPAKKLLQNLTQDCLVTDCKDKWILPGFIDCHVHYPQLDVMASYGEQLLDWLHNYTYPIETRFGDETVARETADFFLDELLRNGTTSAMVFATMHPQSVNALFESASVRNMRIWSGKTLMDRNCPAELQDGADGGYQQSRELLLRWHGQDRLQYAITPRFAPTSSEQQLGVAGQLAAEHPDVYVHTHLAENEAEIAWVAELFPEHASYLDVYRQSGLLRERAIFAHCIHLEDEALTTLKDEGASIAFCPSSNLFLGSGIFDLNRAVASGVRVGLATDVGGGTSLSMLHTIGDAYKALQVRKQTLSAFRALYHATLGAARALYADDRLGNFQPGKEADFVVLDTHSRPLLDRRVRHSDNLNEALFAMMLLGDDRVVRQTYIMGEAAIPSRS